MANEDSKSIDAESEKKTSSTQNPSVGPNQSLHSKWLAARSRRKEVSNEDEEELGLIIRPLVPERHALADNSYHICETRNYPSRFRYDHQFLERTYYGELPVLASPWNDQNNADAAVRNGKESKDTAEYSSPDNIVIPYNDGKKTIKLSEPCMYGVFVTAEAKTDGMQRNDSIDRKEGLRSPPDSKEESKAASTNSILHDVDNTFDRKCDVRNYEFADEARGYKESRQISDRYL